MWLWSPAWNQQSGVEYLFPAICAWWVRDYVYVVYTVYDSPSEDGVSGKIVVHIVLLGSLLNRTTEA